MKIQHPLLVTVAAAGLTAGLGFFSSAASAQSFYTPDANEVTTVYFGTADVTIHSKSSPLSGGPALPSPGAGLDVHDASTVGFGITHYYNEHFGVEAALGVPPTHKTYGTGFIEPAGHISSVREIGPTVFANWRFGEVADKFRPFVGLGINYTKFVDGHSTASGNAASGGPTQISLTDSWGLAGHAGGTYHFDKKWSLTGTVAMADVNSDLTATTTTNSGPVVRTTTIHFHPVVYTFSVGYSF